MADKRRRYANRHSYKAILWFALLVGGIVGLIIMFSGRGYFENEVMWRVVWSARWTARLLALEVVLIALIGLIRLGYQYEWTGFGAAVVQKPGDKEIRPRKTLWDWLGLLIVPVVLAIGGLWFSWAQDDR